MLNAYSTDAIMAIYHDIIGEPAGMGVITSRHGCQFLSVITQANIGGNVSMCYR
ncbi:hypothetical protein FM107_15300 [Sphingobacterium sp. JB170]|nr:hypothetical protein FM107_15300 [Sphingobacterium sp. JB170]